MHKKCETILVLGGCRSGKSSWGQELAETIAEKDRVYIATCVPYDDEMRKRVSHHQDDRDSTWVTVEESVNIAESIVDTSRQASVILVDCLTLWVTNMLMADIAEDVIFKEVERLNAALEKTECPVILVSNEVGMGIVPENKLARQFRDIAGFVNQKVAASVQTVYFTAAGIPVKIKG